MNYHKITYPDVNNGVGCRVTLWVSGCRHHCKNCHNTETWAFNSGIEFGEKSKEELFNILSLPYINGLTMSGGDPMFSYNEVYSLTKEVKEKFPSKNIWLYTGFTLQEIIINKLDKILDYIDFIVDGKFNEELKDISLPFRGSSNQTIWEKNKEGEWVKSSLN